MDILVFTSDDKKLTLTKNEYGLNLYSHNYSFPIAHNIDDILTILKDQLRHKEYLRFEGIIFNLTT